MNQTLATTTDASLGEFYLPTKAGQTITEAGDNPEQPTGAEGSAGQGALAAIVLNTPVESGQIAQIPSKSYLLDGLHGEEVEKMTDERLDRFINGHLTGYIQNLTALAEGLSEKKKRLARKGVTGSGAPTLSKT